VVQVSPQRDVAWRQVPSVVLAPDFLFQDELDADAISLLLQDPQSVRIGQHHDAVQGVLKLGREGLVGHSEELEQRLAAVPFIFRQGGEIEVEFASVGLQQPAQQVKLNRPGKFPVDELPYVLCHAETSRVIVSGMTRAAPTPPQG